jgi:RNA polymerase sigma-70 factor (ECF subfamily)
MREQADVQSTSTPISPAVPVGYDGRPGSSPNLGSHEGISDDELVLRVRAGERELFAEIIRRHYRSVWRIAASGLAADRVATENLVQQSFVDVFEDLHQYRPQPGKDLGCWIRQVARNVVKMELRRQLRETNRMSHYRHYLAALYADDTRAEEEEKRLQRAIASCRTRLGATAARALELRYGEARDISHVAAVLGRTLGATRQLLFRSRMALRLCVEKRLAAE